MIGLVVVTHGRLADEFVAAVEHVVGPQDAIRTVCIGPEDDMDQRRTEILEAVKDVEAGAGVIVLTDMFGGTPSNLAISVMGSGKVEVVAGVNLPMLIKLAEVRDRLALHEAAQAASDAGRKYISVASALLQRTD
jgi:PTS system mannose-specific IIA component